MAVVEMTPARRAAPRDGAHRRRLRRLRLLLCVLFASAPLVLSGGPTSAQTVSPEAALRQLSPAQLEALMAMPAAQRAEAARALGIDIESAAQLLQGASPSVPPGSDALSPENQLLDGPSRPGGGGSQQRPDALAPEATLLVEFRRRAPGAELPAFLAELEGSRAYELDRYGVLHLKDVFHIPLAGLTAVQAAARIEGEPGLEGYRVAVTLLPLRPTGPESLALFGRDFFARARALLVDPATTPIPGDYVVGPGDVIAVALFGADNSQYELTVNREGQLVFPAIGPVTVAGLTLDDVRAELMTRVREQMIGVTASVTIQRLRAIQVFVLGDVAGPGAYTVDSLTTMTNALLLSGGALPGGTLRRVQLKREGRTLATLDLYDLLLRGDTANDRRLQNGDVVFVPPVGDVVGVEGAVNRPALYELRAERTVADLIALAGGLRPEAQAGNARVERLQSDGRRTQLDVDLASAAGLATPLRSGDVLRVSPSLDVTAGLVTLGGHVVQPRDFGWREGMRLTDLIAAPSDLKPGADTAYVVIRREDELGRVSVLDADLRRALAAPGSGADLRIQPRDRVHVFELAQDRSGVLEPIIEELGAQLGRGESLPVAVLSGRVKVPGRYPLTDSMRVSDLIRAGGSLSEGAYLLQAELTRRIVSNGSLVRTEFVEVDLERVIAGDEGADIRLAPHDTLTIKPIPEYRDSESIEIVGEVRFPGTYPLARGESLASVIERAGGLTTLAFPEGSVFTRVELRQREQERLEQLARRLESDLAAAAVSAAQLSEGGDSAQALALGRELLAQVRQAPATGRLVIDLESIIRGGVGSADDVLLRDGDLLIVPRITQEVTVIGEVQAAGSYLHDRSLGVDDYLNLTGGVTRRADRKRIYVVRASGMVETLTDSRWFRRNRIDLAPGDTIVVPLDADRVRPLALWTSVSSIVYQLGLATASARAIGIF